MQKENKKDLMVISKKQYKDGKAYSARTLFKEFKEKYGY